MNSLPPDPYLALGVSKTAPLSEIRGAHRKLVLKCHPDKVQDEALKAAKQDEFQKVQQAYELLSNEAQRAQYDAQVKLNELRKEMGRSGPGGSGSGANVYYAEPRTSSTSYRPKAPAQAYPTSRYESDEARYSTPRRSDSYESKSKSTSREEDRRARRKEEEREARRDAELKEAKREKDVNFVERKKKLDKERRKASEQKTRSYIERSEESDSEDIHRPTRGTQRSRMPDFADILLKGSRRATEIRIDAAERRREKTKASIEQATRYIKTARSVTTAFESSKSAKTPVHVPDSPLVDKIDEGDTARQSSARVTRRTSLDTPNTSRRAQNSSRSRESHRLTGKDKKKSDPRIVNAELPTRTKPTLSSQKSAPPEIASLSSREKPQRASTMDVKYSSKGSPVHPALFRASTFNGSEKVKSRSTSQKHRLMYGTDSESDSESDVPVHTKQASPIRDRPPMQTTSSYKIVRDSNGPRAAERVPDLNAVYEKPRERSSSPRRSTRTASSRPANTRAPPSQPFYVAAPIPGALSLEPEVPNVKTVRPRPRDTQSYSQYTRKPPSTYEEVNVRFSPAIGREDIAYTEDFMRRGSNPETQYPSHKRETLSRTMGYVS